MKRTYTAVITTLVLLGFMCGNKTLAAPFDTAFKLVKINNECQVMIPDARSFETAVEGKAYPYGSKVKTGRKSSVVIQFSAGNVCRVLASTTLTVSEDAKDVKAKTIKLSEGEVAVELGEEFHKDNSLNVETAAAICGAIGCKFTIKSFVEKELSITDAECLEGKLRFSGSDYDIPLFEKDDKVSIAKSSNKSFTRVKNYKGSFSVNHKNNAGEMMSTELKSGYSMKIYRNFSTTGATMLVTILVINPEGKMESSYTYGRNLEGAELTGGPGESKDTAKDKGKGKDVSKDKTEDGLPEPEFPPIAVTPTTTTTTTTSTLPPKDFLTLMGEKETPTPVGKR